MHTAIGSASPLRLAARSQAQMTAEVELDGGAVAADDLEAMIEAL